jgi:hypothetical protein
MGVFMKSNLVVTTSNSTQRDPGGLSCFAFGMWLRGGFIGASVCAIGLVQLFDGDSRPLPALSLAVVGALLAVYNWRRAPKCLEAAKDEAMAVKTDARAPASVLVG